AGELLEQVLADERRVVAGAAGGEDEALGPPQLADVEVEAAEAGGAVGGVEPAAGGVLQRLGLLVDLLEHGVGEDAPGGVRGVPLDVADRGLDRAVLVVEYVEGVGREHAHLAVEQVDDLAGLADEGPGVAGQEVLAAADAQQQRAAQAGADDGARAE